VSFFDKGLNAIARATTFPIKANDEPGMNQESGFIDVTTTKRIGESGGKVARLSFVF
jgi:hypothetical protein